MMKILIFGCSFTAGSWKPHFDSTSDDDIHESRIGWYHFITQFNNHHIQTYAAGGSGYTEWAQVINLLQKNYELEGIDLVVIAETIEPRFGLWKPNINLNMFEKQIIIHNSITVDTNIQLIPSNRCIVRSEPMSMKYMLSCYGIDSSTVNDYIYDVVQSASNRLYTDIAAEYIRLTCKIKNIPILLFSFTDPIMLADGKLVIRVGEQLYWNLLAKNCNSFAGPVDRSTGRMFHQTLHGNMLLGEYLSKRIPSTLPYRNQKF